jgi:adenylate kinase
LDKEEVKNHKCGNKYLKKRKDDNQEVLIYRYDEYMKKTKPVLDYYSSRNNFYEIDGSHKIEAISKKIEQILRL